MSGRHRSRTLLAILTLIALVFITIDYRQHGVEGSLDPLRRGAMQVYAPIQEGFSQVTRPIGSFFGSIGELASLRERNTELEEELEALERQIPTAGDLERENRELRALLGMRERFELETVATRVIAHPPGERSNTVLIDAGGEAGIEAGMAVLDARGLVGKVTVTTPRYAWVELLTSPSARYAVRVAETGETGLLRGRGADPFQLELLEPETRVGAGSQVVTHSFQGSTIPDGLRIGAVVEEDLNTGSSPRFHLVRPFVDFRRLSLVQVVLGAPEPPTEADPDEVIDSPDHERPPPPSADDGEDGDSDDDGDGEAGDGGDDEDEDADAEDEDVVASGPPRSPQPQSAAGA